MNDFDKLIQEKIKKEYDYIAPDRDSLQKINYSVKESIENRHAKDLRVKFYRVAAAVIIAILVAVNGNSIKAFVLNIYEKYLAALESNYEERTLDYAKDLNLTVEIGEASINISQYVVTNKGVDFKITQSSESNIEMVGCELNLEKKGYLTQEMFVKSEGYYIASNVFEDSSWDYTEKEISGTLEIMYMEDDSEVKSVTKDITLDLSDIYQCQETTDKSMEIPVDEEYTITNITIGTWYMKITYEPPKGWNGDSTLMIEQNGEQILFLGGYGDDDQVCSYYQIPEDIKSPLYISVASIVYEGQDSHIKKTGKKHELKLEEYLEEDK